MEHDDNWKNVQRKTFTKWLNTQLVHPINDVYTDLKDGTVLCELLFRLANAKIVHNKIAITRFQKIENVQNALNFLKESKIKLINIGSADIVDGSEKLSLGLIWTIINWFVICRDHATNDGLLKWCRAATTGYDVDIQNFGKSWQDGMGFNAIIHRFRPDLVDYRYMKSSNKLDNLKQAFDIAEKSLDIPKLIDPEDIADTMYPDEKCIMTYVSQLRDKFGDFKDLNIQRKVDDFMYVYDKINKIEYDFSVNYEDYNQLVREIRNNNAKSLEMMETYRKLYDQNQTNVEKLEWKKIQLYSLYGTVRTLNDFYRITKKIPFKFHTEGIRNEIIRCESCLGKINTLGINTNIYSKYVDILSSNFTMERQVEILEKLTYESKDERIKKLVEDKLSIFSVIISRNDGKKLVQEGLKIYKRLDTNSKNNLKSDDVAEILEMLGLIERKNSINFTKDKTNFTQKDLSEIILKVYDENFDIIKIKKAFQQLSEDGKYLKIGKIGSFVNSTKDLMIDTNGEEKIDIESMFNSFTISQ